MLLDPLFGETRLIGVRISSWNLNPALSRFSLFFRFPCPCSSSLFLSERTGDPIELPRGDRIGDAIPSFDRKMYCLSSFFLSGTRLPFGLNHCG